MKKAIRLMTFVIAAMLILAMTGCFAKNNTKHSEGIVPDKDVSINAGEPSKAPVDTSSVNDNKITAEEAKNIALEKAGLTAEEVMFDRVERDYDDGIECYEVEFRKGRTEYSADIAIDGTIIEWEIDND